MRKKYDNEVALTKYQLYSDLYEKFLRLRDGDKKFHPDNLVTAIRRTLQEMANIADGL